MEQDAHILLATKPAKQKLIFLVFPCDVFKQDLVLSSRITTSKVGKLGHLLSRRTICLLLEQLADLEQ